MSGIKAKAIIDPSTGRFIVGNPGGGLLRKGAGDKTNNYETKEAARHDTRHDGLEVQR